MFNIRSLLSGLLLFLLAATAQAASPNNIPTVTSVAVLRAGSYAQTPSVYLKGYTTSGFGSGMLRYDAADSSTADDGCVTFVDAAGARFKRDLYGQPLSVDACGAIPNSDGSTGTDAKAAFNRWLAYLVAHGNSGSLCGWYYSSGALDPITLTVFAQGLVIKGCGFQHTYTPTTPDARVFWNATSTIFLSIGNSSGTSDSYLKASFSDWGIQASNSTHGNGIAVKLVGIAPDFRRFGAVFNNIGVDAENFDGGYMEKSYLNRNQGIGLLLEAAFEFMDLGSEITDNNTAPYGGSSPWSGTNVIIAQGSYVNTSFGLRFIRTNVNSAPGFLIDAAADVYLDEIEAESTASATGVYKPVVAGTTTVVNGLTIIHPHTQNTPIALDRVVNNAQIIENEGLITTTVNTFGAKLSGTVPTIVTSLPSNYRMTNGLTQISPNMCVDGYLSNSANYGSSGVPAPVISNGGDGSLVTTSNSATGFVVGKRYLTLTQTGGSTSPFNVASWANNVGSYGMHAGATLYIDFVAKNGTTFPSLRLVLSGVDSGGSAVTPVTLNSFGNIDSTVNGNAIHDGWTQFSIAQTIPATNGLYSLTGIDLDFDFFNHGTWNIASCSLSLNGQPNQLSTGHDRIAYTASVSSGSPVTYTGMAAAGYIPYLTGESADAVWATISGNDWVIHDANASPQTVHILFVPKSNISQTPGG